MEHQIRARRAPESAAACPVAWVRVGRTASRKNARPRASAATLRVLTPSANSEISPANSVLWRQLVQSEPVPTESPQERLLFALMEAEERGAGKRAWVFSA